MDHRSLRIGACVIAWALLLRLGAQGAFRPVGEFLMKPNIAPLLLYLETGRIVRFSPSEAHLTFAPESPQPVFSAPTEPEKPELPTFSTEDGENVEIRTNASLHPDLGALITRPLSWDLTGDEPAVLIYHTHTTESFTKNGEDYEESGAYRTTDERYNMLSIGSRVAEILEAGGVHVIHDRTFHDYPAYNGSYSRSKKTIAAQLKAHPSLCLVLDLHRDAVGGEKQWKSTVTLNGEKASQLMVVAGTNASGLRHPNWQENLSLALKLHTQLERLVPGICRPLNLRAQRFNQDQSPGALLIEIGTAGNTHQEALRAAEVLAQAILTLAHGTE